MNWYTVVYSSEGISFGGEAATETSKQAAMMSIEEVNMEEQFYLATVKQPIKVEVWRGFEGYESGEEPQVFFITVIANVVMEVVE